MTVGTFNPKTQATAIKNPATALHEIREADRDTAVPKKSLYRYPRLSNE